MQEVDSGKIVSKISKKQHEIIQTITQYRYITYEQLKRKLFPNTNRTQLSKYFSETKRKKLIEQGVIQEHDGVFTTSARGRGSLHQLTVVDTLLDLEAEAKKKGFGFMFTYNLVNENLKPDATVLITDHNRILLCYIEIHLETEKEEVLEEKIEKYRELARGDRFKNKWQEYGFPYSPQSWAFRVLIFSKYERTFNHPRFKNFILGNVEGAIDDL